MINSNYENWLLWTGFITIVTGIVLGICVVAINGFAFLASPAIVGTGLIIISFSFIIYIIKLIIKGVKK